MVAAFARTMKYANTMNLRSAPLFLGGAMLLAAPSALAQQPRPPDPTRHEAPPPAPIGPRAAVDPQGSSRSEEPAAELSQLDPSRKHYNRDMMVAGIALTCIGLASLPIGAAMLAIPSSGDFPTGPVAAVGVIGVGAIFPLIGVPLWAVGGHSPAVPNVAAGPRGVTLRWTF